MDRAATIKREFDEYFQLAEARIAQQGRMLAVVRNALRPFAKIGLAQDDDESRPDMIDGPDLAITPAHVRAARKALENRGGESPLAP